jgi:hypothetical protein
MYTYTRKWESVMLVSKQALLPHKKWWDHEVYFVKMKGVHMNTGSVPARKTKKTALSVEDKKT